MLQLDDIYFNEIHRFLEGKLDVKSFLFRKSGFQNFKHQLFTFIKWSRLKNRIQIGQVDILVHLNERNHLRELVPLIRYFGQKGKKLGVITSNYNVAIELEKLNIKVCSPLKHFHSPRQLQAKSESIENAIASLSSKNSLDKNQIDSLRTFLDIKWQEFQFQYSFYSSALDSSKAKYCLIGNDLPAQGRLFVRLCQSNGIKSYSLQHGYVFKDWISNFHEVSYFLTYGDYSKQVLEAEPRPKSTIVSVGSPYISDILSKPEEIRKESDRLMTRFGIQKRFILITFSGYGHSTSKEAYLKCLESIKWLAESKKDQQIVVKLHPKEKLEDYSAFKSLNNVKLIQNSEVPTSWQYSIFPFLLSTDLLITGASTTAIEAAVYKIPVISMDFGKEYGSVRFRNEGWTVNADSAEEFEQLFEESDKRIENSDSDREKFLSSYYSSGLVQDPNEEVYNLIFNE